jgi:hypothetical protein
MVQQVDAAAAAVNSDDGIRHAGTTAAEVGAGATDCVGCRPGSHKAHTCGKARPRGGCKRPALQALTRNLDFDHPGRRMRCNSCNMCLDKDQQLAQKDEIIAELKRERNEAQRLVALYEEDYEGGDYEDYENEEYEDEDEDEAELARGGNLVGGGASSPATFASSSDDSSVRAPFCLPPSSSWLNPIVPSFGRAPAIQRRMTRLPFTTAAKN